MSGGQKFEPKPESLEETEQLPQLGGSGSALRGLLS